MELEQNAAGKARHADLLQPALHVGFASVGVGALGAGVQGGV